MDIQLPDKSGVECTAQVKELLPSVKIIIVTVYEDSDRIFQALRAGACGYLLKRATRAHHRRIQEARKVGAHDAGNRAQSDREFSGTGRASSESESLSPREKEVLQLVMHGLETRR